MRLLNNSRGVSLIAAIFIIVILAFMGVMFVSLIGTSSLTSVNDLQSAQALYVAEGGVEYVLENRPFPNYSLTAATNLSAGSFTVASPTYLTADPGAAGVTINVQSTATFPNAGRIIIDSEIITYTGRNATQFTGATRGVGGTAAVAHPTANASVYPVTTVTDNPLLAASTTINVTSNVGFSSPGVIIIDLEYIFCSSVNGTTQLTNCTRGYNGLPATAAAHPNLSNVFQYALTSTGTVGNAQRVVERSARQIPGAMMVYAKAAGDPIPYYRRWDGTSWGPEFQANTIGAGRTIQYMVLEFARTRNEAVLGTLDSTGDVQVQVWNGTGWAASTVMGNTTAANSVYQGFDIEYETNGDRALVVYNNNVANQVSYRIWSGLAWTAPANQALATVSIGIPRWIELASNPLAGSNEIAMIVLGASPAVYGLRWTGAGWNNMAVAAAWDTTVATAARKAIDVAYEQVTGRAMFIWGDAVAGDQYYRIWNGAALTANTQLTIAAMGGVANWVRLVPDPTSNRLMYGVQDAGSDLDTRLWSGAAWDTAVQHPKHDATTEAAAARNFDIVFETAPANAGRAWLLWGDGATVSRKQWSGAAWGAATTVGDDTSLVQLLAHPISGAVFSVLYESTASATDDIWESHLTSGGATWSAKFTVWGGPVVASPVMERCAVAAERMPPPLIVQGWREIVR